MEENSKRLIITSILAYAVGTFIFAAGLLTKASISIITFLYYCNDIVICAMLALFNNYKNNKQIKLYLYLFIVGFVFIIINTAALLIFSIIKEVFNFFLYSFI